MQASDKIAFFDFCETLANFQTADVYIDFVREKTKNKRMIRIERIRSFLFNHGWLGFLSMVTRNKYPINKLAKLFQLKGLQRNELEEFAKDYYHEIIKPNLIDKMVKILQQKKQDGFKIVLVSGGYDIYLRYFAEEYGVDNVISTRVGFQNNICTGVFNGVDCLNDNKVVLLNKYYGNRCFISEGYSDSKSDIPFLTWVDEAYVVSKNKHQKWINNYKFKEIIWD